jgi:hypothetical protein
MGQLSNTSRSALATSPFCSISAFYLVALGLILGNGTQDAWAAPPSTTTTLTLASGGAAVTTLTRGSVITLTATVTAGTSPVTPGQVDFCDAVATYCTDIHWLGTAQLTSAGIATLKLLPGNGSHSYKAVFRGTNSYAGSSSTSALLPVSGTNPSVTQIYSSNLTATVSGIGSTAPTGEISFANASGGSILATAVLQGNASASALLGTATTLPASIANLYNPCQQAVCLVATGDLNKDGYPDIAFATAPGTESSGNSPGSWNGQLVAFLGDGKGNFSASATFALPTTMAHLTSLSIADFNGDGIRDVAVGDGTSGTIAIALGNGDGTFTLKGPVSTGGTFSAATVGDFNRDGIPDLAILGSVVQIFNGNGDGTFTASSAAPATVSGGTAIATADFNGDGIADLVVVSSGFMGPITVLLGNGDETFTVSQTLSYSSPIAIADFNQDGKLDLVSAYDGTIATFLGNGNGTFATGPQTSINPQASCAMLVVSPGDFGGEGHVDLAADCGISQQNLGDEIFFGNGDGTFASSPLIAPGGPSGALNLAIADFNGDGISDVTDGGYVWISVNQTATAILNNFTLPAGSGTINVAAQYSGDSNYLPSASNSSIALTAPKGTPTITVTASPNPAIAGAQVTITVTVSGTGATPTGSVGLLDGSASLGTFTLGSGVATYTSSILAAGVHSITAQYAGDSNYTSVISSVLSLTVNASAFTVGTQSGGSTTSTVAAGQPAKYSLSISPAQGYSGTVSFTCSNLPTNASCSFSPSSLSLTGNTPATFTVTIATQSQTTAALRDVRSMRPLLACILLGLPFVSRRRRARLSVLAWTILLYAAAGLSACGGGSSGSGGTSNTGPAKVAPGTYTVQLTVSDGKNSQAQPLTLTVQ